MSDIDPSITLTPTSEPSANAGPNCAGSTGWVPLLVPLEIKTTGFHYIGVLPVDRIPALLQIACDCILSEHERRTKQAAPNAGGETRRQETK